MTDIANPSFGLTKKFVALILLLLGSTALVMIFFFPAIQKYQLLENMKMEARLLAHLFAAEATQSLESNEYGAMNDELNSLKRYDRVLFAIISDVDEKVFSSYLSESESSTPQILLNSLKDKLPATGLYTEIMKERDFLLAVESVNSNGKLQGYSLVGISFTDLNSDLGVIQWISALVAFFGMASGVLIFVISTRRIVNPLLELKDTAEHVCNSNFEDGQDYSIKIKSNDEIGALSTAFNLMFTSIKTKINELNTHTSAQEIATEKILLAMNQFANGDLRSTLDPESASGAMLQIFNGFNQATDQIRKLVTDIVTQATNLKNVSEELKTVSSEILGSANLATDYSASTNELSDTSNRHLESVAAATEEMSTTINDIARNSNDAAKIASNAVMAADGAALAIGNLSQSSTEINDVINIINSIAEQTNLLALNATIEAARAGDAGKGFAVVANEVKSLANETAAATEKIHSQIKSIQTDTGGAIKAVNEIGSVINNINDIQTNIAGSIEEQAVTTGEISKLISQSNNDGKQIQNNMDSLTSSTKTTSAGASMLNESSTELTRIAGKLLQAMTAFKH
jgi:methyl-accepting chemotaxis protein